MRRGLRGRAHVQGVHLVRHRQRAAVDAHIPAPAGDSSAGGQVSGRTCGATGPSRRRARPGSIHPRTYADPPGGDHRHVTARRDHRVLPGRRRRAAQGGGGGSGGGEGCRGGGGEC